MPRVISVGTSNVPYSYNQDVARDFANDLFSHKGEQIARMISVFDNALIESRHFCYPREWFSRDHNFVERSESFVENGLKLSVDALNSCLNNIGADYSDFDHMIYVSSTGISAPTIDALLINELQLNTHLKRTPIWGLGCVAGAVGLSRAIDYVEANPKSAIMLIALEICSLAFQKDDFSKSNIVAIALFSDGAAATLIAGKEHKLYNSSNINLIDSYSTTYYDSLDVMGWDVVETGLKAIFSKDIPTIVRNNVKENILEFIEQYDLSIANLKHFVLHPGGAKVLDEYEKALGLENGSIKHSRKVLKEHGNMSSPTVLYVLKEFMHSNEYNSGEYGLISALGPGFSSELILFQIQ
ncbi:MAG: type III polyketide synthase [Thermodesulfobacteriota bacterium]